MSLTKKAQVLIKQHRKSSKCFEVITEKRELQLEDGSVKVFHVVIGRKNKFTGKVEMYS